MDEFHIKPDGSWEFKGEDSRLRDHSRNQQQFKIWNPLLQRWESHWGDHVYCRDCGADGGYCSQNLPAITYFCDKCWPAASQFSHYIPMLPHEEWRYRNGLPPKGED